MQQFQNNLLKSFLGLGFWVSLSLHVVHLCCCSKPTMESVLMVVHPGQPSHYFSFGSHISAVVMNFGKCIVLYNTKVITFYSHPSLCVVLNKHLIFHC